MKITLAQIAKDEKENLKRLYPLIKDHIDEWVVVIPPKDSAKQYLRDKATVIEKDFTQEIESEYREEMFEYRVELPEDYKLFNFAAARNESFSNATGDYILWLDADDHPEGLENLREFLQEYSKTDVFDVLYDYARDEEDNSISDHMRERLVKNKDSFQWQGGELGLIHETIVSSEAIKRTEIPSDVFKVSHLYQEGHDIASSVRNHTALLYEYLKTEGKDPRTVYYLGISFFNMEQYEFCIKTLMEYIQVGGWDEERYRAWIRIAEAYHQLGDKESSRNAYFNATKELPDYPDAYFGLGESYFSEGEYTKCIEWTRTGMGKPVPQTKSAIDWPKYAFRPLVFMALSCVEVGRPKDGCYWFEQARKQNPDHEWVKKYEDLFAEMKDINDYVTNFVNLGQIAQRLYPDTLPKLAEAIPDEIMDQELLLGFKRKNTEPQKWNDKSVVFFCSYAFEEWGPDSLETGCGGSEEAVIHLTKKLADMGWDVTVFNNCPEEEIRDGVRWVRTERFNPRDEFNILVGWRNNPFLEEKTAKKKYVDVHDVPNNRYFTKEPLKDVILSVKSQYHRSLFPHLEDSNFRILHNGINPEQFKNKSQKQKNSLVWTSSYDRGLEYLLQIWEAVKSDVPDATLDVYYGWNLFDTSAYGQTAEGKKWKKKMLDLLDQEGVTDHGRVGTDVVAEAYRVADIWAYPSDFPEIDCITATKAMAAGCVPVTTDYAVLKERNQGVMVEGDIKDSPVLGKFTDELVKLMKDEKRKEEIRSKLDVSAYTWDEVARKWSEDFEAR